MRHSGARIQNTKSGGRIQETGENRRGDTGTRGKQEPESRSQETGGKQGTTFDV